MTKPYYKPITYHPTKGETMHFHKMTVAQLRAWARENKDKHHLTGVQIVSLKRYHLIAALKGGKTYLDTGIPTATPADPVVESSTALLKDPKVAVDIKGVGAAKDDKLADILAYALKGKISGVLDEDAIADIVTDKLEDVYRDFRNEMFDTARGLEGKINNIKDEIETTVKVVEIKKLDGTTKEIGIQHEKFEEVLSYVATRINVYLVGTSGSGKTFMAEAIADALELDFYSVSVGLQTSKSDLIGYMSATGNYVSTLLRQAYENGGVFLLDELDAGNPNVLTVINAMTANSIAAFPDTMVKKHLDFVLISAGNTYGRGADRQYVGRNPIDAATLDRFAFIDLDIDENLEKMLSPNTTWCKRVQAIRVAIFDLKEKVICSPRASISGGIMVNSGVDFKRVEDVFIFKGVNPEIKKRVLRRVK